MPSPTMPPDEPAAPPAAASGAPGAARWRVRLLGGVDVQGVRGECHQRFPSRAIAALLARLALAPGEAHAREELIERLWPGVELSVGRNRLRQALSTVKSLLEPADEVLAAPLIAADRVQVRVAPGALACDVREFEAAVREARWTAARDLYRGELMPGHYDDWVQEERLRLERLFERVERELAAPGAHARQRNDGEMSSLAPSSAPQAGVRPAAAPAPSEAAVQGSPARWFGGPSLPRRLVQQASAHRLVTLLGPGGVGKTRLAAEVVRLLRESPAGHGDDAPAFDVVAFTSFAEPASVDRFVDTVLASLSLRAQPGLAGVALLRQALAGRRVLLVLDHLGHLPPAAATHVRRLADELPQAHLLVTSRRALEVEGEQCITVGPLALPPVPPPRVEVADAAASPAVQLFVERARAARADFHLSARNASVLASLVHALGGLPLALELVAARMHAASPSGALQQLMRGLHGARAAGGRTASIEAVIAWSWAQLGPPAVRLLCASTVFGGPFTAAALAFVAEDDAAQSRLKALQSLAMLRAEAPPGDAAAAVRFALPPPVREFAAAQAAALLGAEAQARQRARLREWFVQWGGGPAPASAPAPAALRAEAPNLAAAMDSALRDGVPEEALRMVVALRPALADAVLPASLLDTLAAAVATGRGDADLRSRACTALGLLGARIGRPGARADVDRGVALAAPSSPARARALHAAASLRWRLAGDAAGALALVNEARAVLHGDEETRAGLLALSGAIAGAHERDHARAQALQREALALWQQLGNRHALTTGHYNLAVCAERLKHWDEALAHLQAACDSARALRDWQQLSLALNVLGNTRSGLRDWRGALAAYREAVEHAWAALETRALLYALWNAPHALSRLRRPEPAARLMAFASTTWAAQFGALKADGRAEMRRTRRLVTAQIGAARCAAAWAEGERATLAEAVAWMREAGPAGPASDVADAG